MKFLMLKHYRGGKDPVNNERMGNWTQAEWDAHVDYMLAQQDRLKQSGEFVASVALAEAGEWVRFDGDGKPAVTEGPFAETKDLVAGYLLVDVDSKHRALEIAAELSAAPGANGEPLGEWLELRPTLETAAELD